MAIEAHAVIGMDISPVGAPRSPIRVILLTIGTLGIYYLYWLYAIYQEQADHNDEGTSGVAGMLLGVFLFPANWFVLPATIERTYEQAGQEPACSAKTGLWNLIPVVGSIIWLFRVQDSMNRYWESRI
jgi:hypothetical protein